MAKDKYSPTVAACCTGALVQAIVINYTPLLFVTFRRAYNISLSSISFLITISFFIQLMIDITSVFFVRRVGIRKCAVLSQLFSFAGMLALGVLPCVFKNFYAAVMTAAFLYSVGGGLVEIAGSPIVESCPSEKKDARMSFLHSFYAWGQVGVIALATLFFAIFGIDRWQIMACVFSLVPFANFIAFLKVPIPEGVVCQSSRGKGISILKNRLFVVFVGAMICAGAAEQAMAQWASAFAETALGVSKTVGDILGPCLFAACMGTARTLYAGYKGKIKLAYFLLLSGILCVISFLLASFSPTPVTGLIGCALAGFSCGIMWPGVLSLASANIKNGGTEMFSLLAFGGDIGCMAGPAAVGFISGAAGDSLKAGLLGAVIFSAVFTVIMAGQLKRERKTS